MWPVLVQMWPVLVQMCTVSVSMHALAAFLTIPSILCLQSLSAPTFNYTANQADINERMRSILVDWLIDVHLKYATACNTTQHSATQRMRSTLATWHNRPPCAMRPESH